MTDQHPITPPPELVQQWWEEADKQLSPYYDYIATQAARWGADQELEACCILLNGAGIVPLDVAKTYPENQLAARERVANFRAARRPKPPNLVEEALEQLSSIRTAFKIAYGGDLVDTFIRRALERLKELEGTNG